MGRSHRLHGEKDFAWRGGEVSRIENLSDIVFALVLTLAAVESVPASFGELVGLWREALALLPCFALIMMIWRTHHYYFRRFGLQDSVVTALNAILLLLILAYIFPLKFMAVFVVTLFTGGYADDAAIRQVLQIGEVKWLYLIYGGFFAGVYLVFALLYAHALRRADVLALSARERAYSRYEIDNALGVIALTLFVILLAFVLPQPIAPFAGIAFCLMGAVGWGCGALAEKRARKGEAAAG